jgi:UDP-2,3-diacylglucosamine pyrophosphatase LpxH
VRLALRFLQEKRYMKNMFSSILKLLEDTVAQQGPALAWGDENKVVTADKSDPPVWWVRLSSGLLSEEDIEQLAEAGLLANDGAEVRKRFGSRSVLAMGVLIDELRKKAAVSEHGAAKVQILTRKVQELERQLRHAREVNAADLAMESLIDEIRQSYRFEKVKPTKFERQTTSKGKTPAGVPSLFLSDWHWGETVDPHQVQGLNEFNLDIARRRADRVFNQALEQLFLHQAGQSYDGFTLILGGDMFSGNIHEELRITNDAPIHDCLLSLAEQLTRHILRVADQFPWVYVPAVVGNHGRIDKKPSAKNAVKDNYDSLLYKLVQIMVQGNLGTRCNVEFDIAPSLDLTFNLYGTRYLLTHGDQIRGGGGVAGFWPAMLRTAASKLQRLQQAKQDGFNYMLCGHFHKYGNVSNVIVNGSLKGLDEWTYRMCFGYEPPIQALWTTHPDYGITRHEPIFGEDPILDQRSLSAAPVTPSWEIGRVAQLRNANQPGKMKSPRR